MTNRALAGEPASLPRSWLQQIRTPGIQRDRRHNLHRSGFARRYHVLLDPQYPLTTESLLGCLRGMKGRAMRNVWLIMSLCALLIWCTGCSEDQGTSTLLVTEDPPILAKDRPVLVRLESKHETIVITSGPTGPLYTVIAGDGTFLVRDLTLAQLELSNPQIYQRVESAIAAHARLDASQDRRSR